MNHKAKILYVEDNPLSKALARTILEREGYCVFEADDGLSGIKVAQAEKPDLILMDINMPGLDGYEASTRLKGLPGMEDVPVVAFTAKAISKDDHERMLAAGCDGYIPKTSTPEELVEKVEAYLQGKRDLLGTAQRDAGARAYQQRLVERLQDQIEKLTRANEELRLLNNVAQGITSTLNLDELLTLITEQVKDTFEVESCSVLLLAGKNGQLIFKAASGVGASQVIGLRLNPRQGVAGWVAHEGRSVLINDARSDPRFYAGIDELFNLHTRSVLCVPLRFKERVIGVIEAVNKIKGEFDNESLRLLDSLASTAALAIENASLYSDLKQERDNLIRKEEEIRHTIARDLHDGPTQMVAALSMNVEFIKKLKTLAPEKMDQELDNLQQLANEAAHDIRNLLFGLHPTILQTQGLEAAVEVYVERFHDQRGMRLSLDVAPHLTAQISKEAEVVAFIIIQEAVNNAKKHAQASEVTIKLRQTNEMLVIIVQDDGKGFNLAQVSRDYDKRVSFGLVSMMERARLVNAELKLKSEPGQGTSVMLFLPLDQSQPLPNDDEV